MKKTFLTSRKKQELIVEIAVLKNDYDKFVKEKLIFPIRVMDQNRIRVSNGRINTYWRLDLEIEGKIIVERCNTFIEKIELLTLIVVDIILGYLLFINRLSFNKILFLLGILIFEAIHFYYLFVIDPINKIGRFINQCLNNIKK